MSQRNAIIIGAGPAGLTAAYELVTRTDIRPRVVELSAEIGGLSRTVNYKGNRIDLGGHRFFSKVDRVMAWWLHIMPLERAAADEHSLTVSYRNQHRAVPAGVADPATSDLVMLLRQRLSRIFFLRRFFSYPIKLSWQTIANLGVLRFLFAGFSYLAASVRPIRPERSLEDFFINRFGKRLYQTFFRDYTEKVWGVPCSRIKPEWGAQRVKGLSAWKTVTHALRSAFRRSNGIQQKGTETSLIERFLYPKFGPGQMWEEVARRIRDRGGEVVLEREVAKVEWSDSSPRRIIAVHVVNRANAAIERLESDLFFSTMPIKELIRAMGERVPSEVREVADGLVYRDFVTVGLLVRRMSVSPDERIIPDTWVYVQERDVKIGRLQVFNNWSPYMVRDPDTVWLGLEYFCNEGDEIWSQSDRELRELGAAELEKLGFIKVADVIDATVIKQKKTYPAYFGTYDRLDVVRSFVDSFENLFLIGRNGMHRYNNQDHSMLTAMLTVDGICAGAVDRDAIWNVNTEDEYHEEKSASPS